MTRRRRERATVSLFPFLSILVCLMGVLAFIMIGIAVVSATNPGVTIKMEGSHTKRPTFVECHGDQLVLHPERLQVPLYKMEAEGSPFMRLIDRLVRHKTQEYVIFAIYPSGIDCFYKGRSIAKKRGIDFGFEPMLEGWQLRLERS